MIDEKTKRKFRDEPMEKLIDVVDYLKRGRRLDIPLDLDKRENQRRLINAIERVEEGLMWLKLVN